jgi:peptidoglycan/LPS O-acetylase OafA/YrhL
VTQKPLPKPVWYKNTYFWIAGILLVIGILGFPFLLGEEAIRDPGQKRESGLVLIYVVGAAVMLINGVLSHRQTVQHYLESKEGSDS